MPLFEVETTSHIMIACVDNEAAAREFAHANYPSEEVIRVSHRPRDAWVISKNLLGLTGNDRSLRHGARLPGQGAGRQAARRPPLHAADRLRPRRGAQGDRVEHGDRLVRRGTRQPRGARDAVGPPGDPEPSEAHGPVPCTHPRPRPGGRFTLVSANPLRARVGGTADDRTNRSPSQPPSRSRSRSESMTGAAAVRAPRAESPSRSGECHAQGDLSDPGRWAGHPALPAHQVAEQARRPDRGQVSPDRHPDLQLHPLGPAAGSSC